jgi:hypothetical protein
MAESRQETHWVTVPEAARLLDTTEGAVRKRIERGSLHREKRADGRVYVRVDSVETRTDTGETAGQRLTEQYEARIEELREQLASEREANRENRRLLAAALERIPELEAPEPPQSPHSAPEQRSPEGTAPVSEEPIPRSTQNRWQRLRRWVRSDRGE